MAGASILLLFEKPHEILHDVEWNTIFFFIGLFVIIGGITIRTEQYNNGKYIGYALGNKMNVQANINIQEYANSICPYEYGSNEWKGFIMGFIEGVDER